MALMVSRANFISFFIVLGVVYISPACLEVLADSNIAQVHTIAMGWEFNRVLSHNT